MNTQFALKDYKTCINNNVRSGVGSLDNEYQDRSGTKIGEDLHVKCKVHHSFMQYLYRSTVLLLNHTCILAFLIESSRL